MRGGGGYAGVGDPPRLNIVSAVLLKQDFEVLTMYKTLGKVVEYKAGKERRAFLGSLLGAQNSQRWADKDKPSSPLALKELIVWEVSSRITI